ncbi:MAG: dihydrolipoamide acetyltransferase family protein [Candidatus Limnocylindrales bacterium]
MAHPILMPKPGQMTEECTLVAWHKQVGDEIRRGDILFEIETDKSNMDVESFDDGVLLAQLVAEGQMVPVNTVCAYVGEAGEAIPAHSAGPGAPVVAPAPAPRGPVPAAPGRAAAAGSSQAAQKADRVAPGPSSPATRVAISPRASRLAAELGIDPRSVTGSGPDGRITERDIQVAHAAGDSPGGTDGLATGPIGATSTAAAPPVTPAPGVPIEGEDEPIPLSRMRRVIAERLTLSHTTIPHFTVTVAVDVTRLQALRQDLKLAGTRLSVTDFVLSATARCLVDLPEVNARTDGVQVWRRRRVHLGLAVSLPGGLVVPVIRDADRLSVDEIHDRASALAESARDGTLAPDDMTGSTFTVSNLGMYGVDAFTAIINPGEAAILAVSSAVPTPVALEGGIAVRSIMRLTLSADHRLVDGELGARFLGAVRRRLEDPGSLRLEIANT